MTRLAAVRTVMSGIPAQLCTSELAFAAAQQSQAGSLAAVALHDLVLLVVTALARRLRTGIGVTGGKRARRVWDRAGSLLRISLLYIYYKNSNI